MGGLDHPNVERGHRRGRCGDDGVTVVLAPLEHIFRRQTFGECRDLVVGVHDARTSLADFTGEDEVFVEDTAGKTVVGRLRGEPRDASDQIVLPLVPATEESLEAILVGIHHGERFARAILRESVVLLALIRGDRVHRHTPWFCPTLGERLSQNETSFLRLTIYS